MITGFNTDVEFDGKTYHVQTEDKGLETPFLLTLIYDKGTILASKRTPYEDLFEKGFSEDALAERLQRQHSLVCAAINAGRLNDLIELSKKDSAKSSATPPAAPGIADPFRENSDKSVAIPKPSIDISIIEAADEPQVGVVSIIDDPVEVPLEAVAIVSDLAGKERPTHNRLCVEFINETTLRSGERKNVTFLVCRGSERKVINNADILVKIIGSNFRPQIFHSITDQNGLAQMDVELPNFTGGRAAFLVRASNGGEEIELRRSIHQS
ncbi:MAG: hypothetical protein ACJ72Z_11370 [Pyrinomonadaceae bacterium]